MLQAPSVDFKAKLFQADMMKTKKSSLMTPDPYHIPGYCGYCPQFKYQIGETFGRTTSSLLTTTTVASSGKPVLADIDPEQPPRQDNRKAIIAARTFSLGDQKLSDQMVPGYTGYIPKAEHYYGKSYAETSRSAIASFQNDQLQHHQDAKNLRTIAELQRGKQVLPELISEKTRVISKYKVPLKPITSHPEEYYSPKAMQHSLSPFTLSNDDPKKFLMSGYTGFVPLSRGFIGKGYPLLTNKALCSFSDETARVKAIQDQPVVIKRPMVKPTKTSTIYELKGTGLVPHYTGHVPGEKFRYGMTFGYSTQFAQKALTA